MKKYLYLLMLVLLVGKTSVSQTPEPSLPYCSIPVSPYPVTIRQSDGSLLTIIGRGSQAKSWTETVDGYTVVKRRDLYEYAKKENGQLVPSGVVARDLRNRSGSDEKLLGTLRKSLEPDLLNVGNLKEAPQFAESPMEVRSFPASGKRKSLLILIKYPDLPNRFSTADFGNLMNLRDYRGTGSFRDYFLKSSFGQLDVETDVMEWVTARQPYQYYGYQNGYGRSQELVREAVDAAQAAGVDFSQYDNDKDGTVDGINVVHSGPAAEEGSQTQYIWSHRWGLGARQVVYDGVRINDYIMNPEIRIRSNSITGIGVFCHEFGHLMGLPDLYDTSFESEGVGNWSLMGGASWLGEEHSPGNLCAWSKFTLGWINPSVISSSGTYTLNPASESAECFRINTGRSNEYFLIENRQQVGLDTELPGSGLAIWHINSSQSSNTNFNRKLVDLEEADGLNELDTRGFGRGDDGDLFPGSSVNSSFDDFTKPDSKTYTLENTGISIKDLSIDGGIGSFSFEGYSGDFAVTAFSPTRGGVGSIVNITGSNLTLTKTVYFGGVPAASFSVVSPSSIMAVVGEGASGAVTIGNGALNREISGFSFFKKPEIASFSPKSSLAGGSVNLVGKNLLGATEVNFGGTAAASFQVLSDTTITAVVGDGASGDVALNTPGGNTSLPGFSFLLPSSPAISAFAPATVCSDVPATITISGTNFTGATAVSIGGNAASSFRIESSSVIVAIWNSPQQGSITVTTPVGIAISDSQLIVNPLPEALISADGPTSFFTGGGVRLSASSDSGYLYSWYRDGQVISGESDSAYIASVSGSYTVSITSKNCSAVSPAVVVTVSPVAPVPTISSFTPAVACSSDSVTLRIIGANFTGATAVRIGSLDATFFEVESPTTISAIVSARQAGTVSVSTPAGTAVSDSIFTILPVPAAVITAGGPTTFLSGGNVLLSTGADSTYSYAWFRDGQPISGQIGSNYTATSGGSYTARITSKGCLAISSALVVTVIPVNTVPTVNAFTPEAGCSSTALTLTITGANFIGTSAVTIDGLAATSFQVESSSTITALFNAPRSGKVSVTTPAGTAISSDSLTVNPLPSAVISAAGPTIFESGGSVVLSTEANSGFTYTWYRDGEEISGQNNSTYTVTSGGSYTVRVTSMGCGAISSEIVVTVNPLPPAPTISSFTPASVCGEGSFTVTINGTNLSEASAVSIGGFAADSFRVESPSTIFAVVNSPQPGSITVITPNGTATSAGSFIVNPMPAAVIRANGPTTFLSGGSVLLSADADSAYSYAWYLDGQVLSGQIGSTYTATLGGSYTVSITSKGCQAISSAVVVTVNPVNSVPIISSFTPETGCSSTPVTLTITGTNFTGATAVTVDGLAVPSFQVVSSSTITALVNAPRSGKVSVTTPAGTAISSGSLTVNPLPSAVISAAGPTLFVSGGSVLLSTEANSGYTYTWYKDGQEISGQDNSTFTVTAGGSYTVSVISKGCQSFSSALVVTVNPLPPPPTISSFTPVSVCGNDPISVTITGTNFTGASSVRIGGVAVSSFKVESPLTISAVLNAPVSGILSVTTPAGSALSSSSLTVNPLPGAVIRAGGPTSFFTGGSVLLSADMSPGYTYAWYRNGEVISGQTSSGYTATMSGSYSVTVSSKGCLTQSTAISVSAIFNLPVNNFNISTISESCKTSDNGQIHISAVEPLAYKASITGNGKTDSYPFTKNLAINDLSAGSYKICITVEGQPDYERCYDLAISEPKDLSVYAFVDKEQNTITLNLNGAKLYMIEINGAAYQTSNSNLTLSLIQGVNKIRISTDTKCQGTFEKTINVSRETTIFPNPFTNTLNVNLGNSPASKVLTEIYNIEGRLVQKQDYAFSEILQLELSALKSGFYTLKLTIDHSETYYKIVKL